MYSSTCRRRQRYVPDEIVTRKIRSRWCTRYNSDNNNGPVCTIVYNRKVRTFARMYTGAYAFMPMIYCLTKTLNAIYFWLS